MLSKSKPAKKPKTIAKCPTGIIGLDDITEGGLPRNRSTLVCGGVGSGKTMFSMEFLIRGAVNYKEPGLFVAFEETEEELELNVASLGFDIQDLTTRGLLVLDYIKIDRTEFKEIGNYNLDGLFIRLTNTINRYKIKRVVLDTIEMLFSNLSNELILRSELQRLLRWFKTKKVTVVITAEKGINSFSRYGLEEYVADCVILLDNRMDQQISTRRIRIAKYRGSSHGSNEYPFLINAHGFSITAITSIKLDYSVSKKHISSGIKQLDTMLSGMGFFRGSSILISGPAGIGKSSFAASFANSVCASGEKCIYFAFEESVDQIIRNMTSIGLDLDKWRKKGLLRFHAISPDAAGLETHLNDIQILTREFKPSVVIIDPITNLKSVGNVYEVQDVLSILVAFFKKQHITVMLTSLISEQAAIEHSETSVGVSSIMDTWIYLQYIYGEAERNRGISVLKSRGMTHSNQLREVILSKNGISFEDVYVGPGKVLAGSARIAQANQLAIDNSNREAKIQQQERKLKIENKTLEAKIITLQAMLEESKIEINYFNRQKAHIQQLATANRTEISKMRMADLVPSKSTKHKKKEVKNGKKQKVNKGKS